MSTPSPTPASPTPETSAPSGSKRTWTGLEIYPLVVVILIIGGRVTELFRAFIDRTFEVDLALRGEEPVTTQLGDHEVLARGVIDFRLPADDLAGATQGFLIAADIILVLGLLLAGWCAVRAIGLVSKGLAFDPRTRRSMRGLFFSVFAAGAVSGIVQMLGDNLVIRDLGLAELPIDNSIQSGLIWGWLAVLGGIGVIGLLLDRGARVEDELEGVI
ncbi:MULTISPECIES: hypothetical protein [Brevibacterium]|uniref:DUF2975 domain-containing protein n=1 Tax=Brevibacterium pityocampae TaxID=506594 RepID=A0ABP8J744_9MICO|nr:hypothetical protein [Brevibacterium sp. CS2]QCP04118.1 hypothetical protein FDF13_01330 [Brevibacterium sp. CS2]